MTITFSGASTDGTAGWGPGSQLGIYVLNEPLGRGGMGQVWKAFDTHGQRDVAIKLLPPEFRGNEDAIAQVRAAFQTIHALTHQHIVKTIGLIDDPLSGPYVVMDYAPGVTLSRFVRDHQSQHGPLTMAQVVELLSPVAEALDYAHRKGVLHRDIKPTNLLVQTGPNLEVQEVRLIDFGLAAEIRHSMTKHTNKSVDTRGTRPYMSPEQLRGKRTLWDGRSDQYALAVVAYELLAGGLPFEGDDDFVLMHAILNELPELLSGRPQGVNAVVMRGLSKTRDDRFESCTAFVKALDQASRTGQSEPKENPEDLATFVAKTQIQVDQAHDQARRAFAQYDYTQVVQLLSNVPEHLRDGELMRSAATNRDRFAELERLIRAAVQAMQLKGLRSLVDEAVQLDPRRDDLQRLQDQLRQTALLFKAGLMNGGAKAGERKSFKLNGIEYAFRWCPPGKFTMGSPKGETGRHDTEDQVQVELTKGFWMQETVVTQSMWWGVMESQPWQGQQYVKEGPNYPATYADWSGAAEFCRRLAIATESSQSKIVLPTESQWEYACRAGTTAAYSFGVEQAKLGEYAWFVDNAHTIGESYAHEVGKKKPNPWGLSDMHGNVWEWCQDAHEKQLPGGRDPIVASGSSRVLRGGSWNFSAINARCSCRYYNDPAVRRSFIGFRVIVEL